MGCWCAAGWSRSSRDSTIAYTVPDTAVAVLSTGFCGAMATYSTFGYETIGFWNSGPGFTPGSTRWSVWSPARCGVPCIDA